VLGLLAATEPILCRPGGGSCFLSRSAAMSACPYRKDFYAKLGSDPAKVQEELRVYLASLEKIVGILKGFLDSKEAKW